MTDLLVFLSVLLVLIGIAGIAAGMSGARTDAPSVIAVLQHDAFLPDATLPPIPVRGGGGRTTGRTTDSVSFRRTSTFRDRSGRIITARWSGTSSVSY